MAREFFESSNANSQVTAFWDSLDGSAFSPRLVEKVWTANRCSQLNCQLIASMPLRFEGTTEPAWVSNPDPVWYPNGIGDAVFSAMWSKYNWGDAFLYVTSRYANGLPSAWTVLDPAAMTVQLINGQRYYTSNGVPLSGDDVVQVSRDPRGGLRGTSALRTYAASLSGLLAASELAKVMMSEGSVPNAVLKSARKLTEDQAVALQNQWVDRTAVRRGAPAVLPPEIDFEMLSFSPADLLLLDAQEWDAKTIASAFGVPAFMLNMSLEGGLTYQNPEMLFEVWWRQELKPAAEQLSDALSAQMLPRGASVTFDARAILAPAQADIHKNAIEALAAGAITVDEYRRIVWQLDSIADPSALGDLTEPGSAGASPADQPSQTVIELRPTQAVST